MQRDCHANVCDVSATWCRFVVFTSIKLSNTLVWACAFLTSLNRVAATRSYLFKSDNWCTTVACVVKAHMEIMHLYRPLNLNQRVLRNFKIIKAKTMRSFVITSQLDLVNALLCILPLNTFLIRAITDLKLVVFCLNIQNLLYCWMLIFRIGA
jgi:hypothetical protein